MVFADEAAQDAVSLDRLLAGLCGGWAVGAEWWAEVAGSVRPVLVVMGDVFVEYCAHVALSEEEHPVGHF